MPQQLLRPHAAEEAAGAPLGEHCSALAKDTIDRTADKANGGHIRVSVRVRPLPPGDDSIIEVAGEGAIAVRKLAASGGNEFLKSQQGRTEERMFDRVFGPAATQAEVYAWTCAPLVNAAVREGRCATVFVYGATGAGKTHTMFGEREEAQQGLIQRAVREVFDAVGLRTASTHSRLPLDVKVSFLDIYNESVRDLLQEGGALCKVLEDERRGLVKVTNLREVPVRSADEALRQLRVGLQARKVEATAANARSSRSHAVFQLTVESVEPPRPGPGNPIFQRQTAEMRRVHTRISLIDLAGSERATQTQNVGSALKDGAKINTSLLALANCIDALVYRSGREGAQTPRRKPPYRDSKLTLLLKGSLTSDCLVSMIANVHPGRDHFEDSNNTLEYAKRASVVKAPALVRPARATSLPASTSRPPSPSPPASPRSSAESPIAVRHSSIGGARVCAGLAAATPPAPAPPGSAGVRQQRGPLTRSRTVPAPALRAAAEAEDAWARWDPEGGSDAAAGAARPAAGLVAAPNRHASRATLLPSALPAPPRSRAEPRDRNSASELVGGSSSSSRGLSVRTLEQAPTQIPAPPLPDATLKAALTDFAGPGSRSSSFGTAEGTPQQSSPPSTPEAKRRGGPPSPLEISPENRAAPPLGIQTPSGVSGRSCGLPAPNQSTSPGLDDRPSLKALGEEFPSERQRRPVRHTASPLREGFPGGEMLGSPVVPNSTLFLRLIDQLQEEKAAIDARLTTVLVDRERLEAENARLRAANLEKDRQLARILAGLRCEGAGAGSPTLHKPSPPQLPSPYVWRAGA